MYIRIILVLFVSNSNAKEKNMFPCKRDKVSQQLTVSYEAQFVMYQ